MTEHAANIVGAALVAAFWLAWALFSETRHNHGFWVAVLLPFALLVLPFLWIVFLLFKYSSYLVFTILGRKEEHHEFIRQVQVRLGIFL